MSLISYLIHAGTASLMCKVICLFVIRQMRRSVAFQPYILRFENTTVLFLLKSELRLLNIAEVIILFSTYPSC